MYPSKERNCTDSSSLLAANTVLVADGGHGAWFGLAHFNIHMSNYARVRIASKIARG